MNVLLGNWLLSTPVWLIGIILIAGMLAAAWFGTWLRVRHDRRKADSTAAADSSHKEDKGSSQEGLVVSAVMGLLALLLGFTFSLSLDRYNDRRSGVLEEANAIGTTYLRTQLLEEPYRSRISGLLVTYADLRLELWKVSPGAEADAALKQDDRVLNELWTETVAAFPTIRGYDFSSSYLETMNAMIDMDATRKAARRAHIPPEVFLLLLLYQFVAAGVLGYVLVGERGRQAAAFLFLLFGLSLILVIDLRSTERWWDYRFAAADAGCNRNDENPSAIGVQSRGRLALVKHSIL